MTQQQKGFTLIELLVVMTIVGVLAAVVTTYVKRSIDASKMAAAKQQLNAFVKIVGEVKQETGMTLLDIMISPIGGSDGNIGFAWYSGRCQQASYGGAQGTNCTATWDRLLNKLELMSPFAKGLSTTMHRDPWGGAYGFDANEMSRPSGSVSGCTYKDDVGTFGPEQKYETSQSYFVDIPNVKCPG